MYCENCGKKIDEDSIFCEHCGKKVKKSKISILYKERKGLLLILLFAVCGILFFFELQYFNSPQNAMKRYLKNWINKNYDTILESQGNYDSEFVTKEVLEEVFYENDEYLMTSFKVNSCEISQDDKSAICYISYHMKKNGLTYEKTYYLEKKDSYKLGIFREWDIKSHDFEIINDFKLFLPNDSKGTLLGYDILDYRNTMCDKSGYDCYMIPAILPGVYSLKIVMNTGMSLEKDIKVSNQGYTYQFMIEDASSEFQEESIKMATNLIELFYNSASKQKDFKDLETNYEIALLKESYESLKKDIKDSSLTNLQVKDMKIKGISMNEEGEILLTFQMSYEYDLKYKKDDKNVDHHGESNDTFYITTKNVELKEIVKIDSLVTYFSKKY